jgi:hypothetical protein
MLTEPLQTKRIVGVVLYAVVMYNIKVRDQFCPTLLFFKYENKPENKA